jgi:uncharacterized protein YeaC (DUF1315 family)
MINSVTELLNSMTPDIYHNLKRAVELGKWSHGEVLSNEQRELCCQAVIIYEEKHLPLEQRSGYIPPKKHTHCGSSTGEIADDDEQPLRFS